MYAVFLAVALAILGLVRSCTLDYSPPSGPIGGSSSQPGSNNPSKDDDKGPDCTNKGAPIWRVDFNNQNLIVSDTPLWVNSAYGDGLNFTLTYNLLSGSENKYSTGANWSNSFHQFIDFDSEQGVYKHYMGDGRIDIYSKTSGSTNYTINRSYLMSGEAAGAPEFLVADGGITLSYSGGYREKFVKASDGHYVISTSSDAYGNKTQYEYNNGELSTVTGADGHSISLSYDSDGLLTEVMDSIGRSAHLEYNDQQHLVAITDMQGYRAELGYDDNTYISSITDAKGTTKFLVERGNENGERTTEYPDYGEPLGKSTRLTVTSPLGDKSEYFYNSDTGKAWHVAREDYIEYQSDNINNAQSDVPKKIYEYKRYSDGYSRISKVYFQDKTWVSYDYDSHRNLSGLTYSSGETYHYKNNENGLVTQYTDADGNVTSYNYDSNNNLLSTISDFGTTTYAYDVNNQLISETDAKGNVTKYSYNSRGQLSSVTNAKSETVSLSYGANGYVSSVTKQGVALASYQHDEAGRIVSVTDRYGRSTKYTYDKINQVTKIASPGGRSKTIQMGSCPYIPSAETLPGERTYHYEYDANKRLKTVIDPMQGQVRLLRNKDGSVIGLIDANQNKTEFTYDVAGKVTSKTYADGNGLRYSYTSQGQLHKVTNARGITKTYQYDSSNKLSSITYSDSTPGISYAYDEHGRISKITDGNGETTYQYAATGELEAVDGPFDNDTISFAYNELYQLSSLSVNGNVNSQYAYDAFGRVTDINALGEVFSYTYNDTKTAPEVITTYPNGLRQVTTVNKEGDLAGIDYFKGDTSLAQFGYEFNVAGKISSLDTTEPFSAEPVSFKATYNEVNQIRTYNGQSGVFIYDQDGNVVNGVLADNTPFEAEYDAENRLTSIQFTYDNSIIRESFSYSFQHFMTGYERTVNGTLVESKQFVRLGLLELQERNGSGDVIAENAWRLDAPGGIGGLLVRKSGDNKYTYMTNHLGHVYGVFDQTGTRVESHAYSPYGAISGDDLSVQPFGMSTKRSDFASGLVYFGYRFYVPHLGRWLNRDPLQEQGGINLYGYVHGDPLGYVDPDGRFVFVALWGWSAATAMADLAVAGAATWSLQQNYNKTAKGYGVFSNNPESGDAESNNNDDCSWGSSGGNKGNKGKKFRGGKKKDRDKWYGYNDKKFQDWWHRSGKKEWGQDIEDPKMAKEIWDYWNDIGQPRR